MSFFNEVTDDVKYVLKNQLNDEEYNRLKDFDLIFQILDAICDSIFNRNSIGVCWFRLSN